MHGHAPQPAGLSDCPDGLRCRTKASPPGIELILVYPDEHEQAFPRGVEGLAAGHLGRGQREPSAPD